MPDLGTERAAAQQHELGLDSDLEPYSEDADPFLDHGDVQLEERRQRSLALEVRGRPWLLACCAWYLNSCPLFLSLVTVHALTQQLSGHHSLLFQSFSLSPHLLVPARRLCNFIFTLLMRVACLPRLYVCLCLHSTEI